MKGVAVLGQYSNYEHDVTLVKKMGDVTRVIQMSACRISGLEIEKAHSFTPKNTVNDEKLSNSISRTKSKIQELVLCNDWHYFVTLTLNPEKYDRFDLGTYKRHLGEFLHNFNRRRNESDKVKYLLIPEQHKNGAWHMHGLILGLNQDELYVNDNGYLSWSAYNDKFGYMSITLIRDRHRTANYITKYITKDLERTIRELGAHLYYASKGLNKSELIFKGHAELHDKWDYEHPDGYCKIKTYSSDKDLSEYLEVL